MKRIPLLFILMLFASHAFGQTLQQGLQEYKRGQFKNAEASLSKALPKAKNPGEKSQILKYLGISQYMLGRKPDAGKSFHDALAANPKISISPDEVLDESVVQFFEHQKPGASPSGSKSAVAAAAPVQGGGTTPVKKAKLTTLTVKSNVSASVAIDGILVGQTNTALETEAGRVILEITSPGYTMRRVATKITANVANRIEVNLEKPKPKPVPVAKAPAQGSNAKTAIASAPKTAAGKGAALTAATGKKKSQDDLFKDADQPLPDAQPQAGQQQAQQPMPQQQQQPQQQMGYPVQQQQIAQYQLPPQVIQQPLYAPVYQQPMYAQPMYQQPYPQPYGYGQPPMQSYGPPAPPAYDQYAASGYNAQQLPPPVTNSGPANAPPPSIDPDSGDSSRDSGKPSQAGATFVKILPFGAGQFYNKSYLKGILFLGAEAGALWFWYDNYNQGNIESKKAQQDIDQLNSQKTDPSADTTAIDAAIAKRQDDSKKYLSQTDQNAMLSLICFGGFHVLGVIDAFVFDDAPKKSLKKKKKARRSGFSFNLDRNPHMPYFAYDFELDGTAVEDWEDATLQFGYTAPLTPMDSHAILFGIKGEF